MAKKRYVSDVDLWLSHECRKVLAGQEFETEFPMANVNGKEVPMRLEPHIKEVKKQGQKDEKPDSAGDNLV